ncbi:MAG: hypothetical protein C4528_04570 [Gammaproteobacteria bacterium]|nr:MAG: hypothetical protein C4528_04570 [Gammaproteobacteria bacterium]
MVVEKKAGEWDYKNPMWAFELRPGKYLEVEQIQYGVVPSGFSEAASAKPLSIGKQYLVMGFGPGSGGSVEFELMK